MARGKKAQLIGPKIFRTAIHAAIAALLSGCALVPVHCRDGVTVVRQGSIQMCRSL